MTQSQYMAQLSQHDLGSPDPLAISTNAPPATSSPRKPRTVMHRSKGASNIYDSTPTTTLACEQSSPSHILAEASSPWRIQITVESSSEGGVCVMPHAATKTVKIPLKDEGVAAHGLNSHKPTRSAITSSPSSKRKGAVTAGRRRRQSVTDLEAVVLGDDADSDEWAENISSRNTNKTAKRRSSARSLSTSNVPTSAARSSTDDEQPASPEPRQIDPNRISVRRRANSGKRQAADVARASTEEDVGTESYRKVSVNSTRSYPTPSPTPSHQEEHSEPAGFDTIMESEGFTMIDLESIHSVRYLRSSPALEMPQPDAGFKGQVSSVAVGSDQEPTTFGAQKTFPSYLRLAEGETDILSGGPSSPAVEGSVQKQSSSLHAPSVQNTRRITPCTYSSPSLPSPPKWMAVQSRSLHAPSEARKATEELQAALEPPSATADAARRPDSGSIGSRQNSEDVFEGFDSGVQRELRAGLRFGEELARRQASPQQRWQGPHSRLDNDNGKNDPQINDNLSRTESLTSTISSPTQDWQTKRHMTIAQASCVDPKQVVVIDSDDSGADEGSVGAVGTYRDVEQVDKGADIWLIEAKDSSSSPNEELTPGPNQFGSSLLVEKRPRGTSNLRPTDDDILDQDSIVSAPQEGESAISGLFWRQPEEHDLRFGARRLQSLRRELQTKAIMTGDRRRSGSFGLDQMMRRSSEQDSPSASDHEDESLIEQEEATIGSIAPEFQEEPFSQDCEAAAAAEEAENEPPAVEDLHYLPLLQDELATPEIPRTPSPEGQHRRPPTPRSALKGGRQSFGAAKGRANQSTVQDLPNDQIPRRVVWATRSCHVDEDWIESSRSMKDDEDDEEASLLSDDLEKQSRTIKTFAAEAERNVEQEQPLYCAVAGQDCLTAEPSSRTELHLHATDSEEQWYTTSRPTSKLNLDSPEDNQERQQHSARSSSNGRTHRNDKRSSSNKVKVPSYLRPPSYPSDPTRSTSAPLSVAGFFTNTHFRTLHIIYRKSQRSRFHAPELSDARLDIQHLVRKKWSISVDEGRAGLGGFTFKVGEMEGRVLERFCREVEWGYLADRVNDVGELFQEGQIWGGQQGCKHGNGAVKWRWSCGQIAEWLGRIVVGEVVRDEEYRS